MSPGVSPYLANTVSLSRSSHWSASANFSSAGPGSRRRGMIATPATPLTPRPPAGITIHQATSDADLTAATTVQHHAYQMPRPPGPHDIARLTRLTRLVRTSVF